MASRFSDAWQVLPHGPLEQLAENLWRVEGSLKGMSLKRVMTVARRSDGSLVIHSAIALAEEEQRKLEALGTPSVMLVPNRGHRLDAPAPGEAPVCQGPEGTPRRVGVARGHSGPGPAHRLAREGRFSQQWVTATFQPGSARNHHGRLSDGRGVAGVDASGQALPCAASLARRVLSPAAPAMSGPHDLFARYTFGRPERAAAELRAVLPPRIVSQVDWSTLQRESGSVVDPELRETESDLLFSARLRGGRPLLLYVLLEHQSHVNRWMALRMLRYVVRQLEHWRKAHPENEKLPVVVPLVMYHGPDGAWSAPRRVEDLFELPDEVEEQEGWRALMPRFEYLLDDLTAERAEALMARPGPALARLALLVLRYGRTEELTWRLPDWVALFAEVHAAPQGDEELGLVVRYLFRVGDRSVREAMRGVLRSVMETHRAEDLMRTYGEELIEEGIERGLKQGLKQGLEQGRAQGRAQGLEQGRALGQAEGVLRILASRGILVDEQVRQRILACTDIAILDRWFDRALTATTLSEVLGDLTQ